jgi:3-phosphoshikimate 1-carboxyvinyltransferase
MKLLKVYPSRGISGGSINTPSSKPETQRAILTATLAGGTSRVSNDLRCLETTIMKDACRAIGSQITEYPNYLEVTGINHDSLLAKEVPVINCLGSGLVARTFLTLSSVLPFPVCITGDEILKNRAIAPLVSTLEGLGVQLEYLGEPGKLPIVNRSTHLPGGSCILPGNISSQFTSALLLAAPLADTPLEIAIDGVVYSQSYIRQTIAAMERAGVSVEYSEDLNFFRVTPSQYQAVDTHVSGDYTSASYPLALAALFPGTTRLLNMSAHSLQGEKAIVDLLKALNLKTYFDESRQELIVENDLPYLEGDIEFDATNCPNIVPTLAAIGAFVRGRFRVTGGTVTNYHKCPRIDAMIAELRKLGVKIEPIFKDDICDGFEIQGKSEYRGGVTLSSWGDHRIFMSLFVASLKMMEPNFLEGFEAVDCSFPGFLAGFEGLGAKFEVVQDVPVMV